MSNRATVKKILKRYGSSAVEMRFKKKSKRSTAEICGVNRAREILK